MLVTKWPFAFQFKNHVPERPFVFEVKKEKRKNKNIFLRFQIDFHVETTKTV